MDTSALPHPPRRVPFLGDVLGVDPGTPIQDSIRLGRDLGPIFVRKVLGTELVLVSGIDLVTELNDETKFGKYLSPALRQLRGIVGDGLFTAYTEEPNWQLAHDILMPAFTKEAMRGYHSVMLDVARELITRWDAVDGPVEVTPDTTRLTLETIGRTGFGYSFGVFERDEPHPAVAVMMRALRQAQRRAVPLFSAGAMMLGAERRRRADIRWLTGFVDDVIERRRLEGRRLEGGGRDLAGLMLNERHPETGARLDPVNIRHQIITFLVAGHETTSGALSFALYYLTSHPEVLARAQAEVDELWGNDPDPEPEYGDIAKLRYLRRVLDESLRLWPTAPAYTRQARADVRLGGRYDMRAGDHVIVVTPLLHRDPDAWGPDAEHFDPDRFAPGVARKRPAHAYRPFGTGLRACIGRQFALHEAVMALGLLVHRYNFTTDPGYTLRVDEALTFKPAGFRVHLTRRTTRVTLRMAGAGLSQGRAAVFRAGEAAETTGTATTKGDNYGQCRRRS